MFRGQQSRLLGRVPPMFGERSHYEDWPLWYWGFAAVLGVVLSVLVPIVVAVAIG